MQTSIRTLRFTLPSVVLLGCASAYAAVGSPNDPAIGWASQNGGTTGGKGGTEVTVTTLADLQKYAKDSKPYIIWVKGTLGDAGKSGEGNATVVSVASNKSILGLPGAHYNGNITISGSKNIIIRNLAVQGAGACDNDCGSAGESRLDAITIISGATNVWLDHLDVYDGEDGNTDITKKADFVTLSWVKFHYTSKSFPSGTKGKSHRFSNLLGGDIDEGSDGKLNVTFYKTWWGEGVAERMPRIRFGKVHVANCLFTSTDPGQSHCVRAAGLANVRVEKSVFIGQKKPLDLYEETNDAGKTVGPTAASMIDNIYQNCSGNTTGKGTAFTPPYTLNLTAAASVQSEVSDAKNGAGATLSWSTTGLSDHSVDPTGWRLNLVNQDWVLANTSTTTNKVSILDATGRQLESFSLASGASSKLTPSSTVRFARIEPATGGCRTVAIPGL